MDSSSVVVLFSANCEFILPRHPNVLLSAISALVWLVRSPTNEKHSECDYVFFTMLDLVQAPQVGFEAICVLRSWCFFAVWWRAAIYWLLTGVLSLQCRCLIGYFKMFKFYIWGRRWDICNTSLNTCVCGAPVCMCEDRLFTDAVLLSW